MVLFLSQSRY